MILFTSLSLPAVLGVPMPANEIMYAIVTLLGEMTTLLTFILFGIVVVLSYIRDVYEAEVHPYPRHFEKTVESTPDVLFVVFPTALVVYMLVPSLGFIFAGELDMETAFEITVVGHQWYWSYEYKLNIYETLYGAISPRIIAFEFDPVLNTSSATNRLLDVDNRVIMPIHTLIRCAVTSQDVIHSWAIPQLGVKVDAIPGRLTVFVLSTGIPGVFYGQCSELCGVNHAFMPICLQSVQADEFHSWVLLMDSVKIKTNHCLELMDSLCGHGNLRDAIERTNAD